MSDNHKALAVSCFNSVWDLIDKVNCSDDDNLKMIHMAHTSRFHWGEIGTPLEFSRGEWQISRVYSLVGLGESALYHGKQALKYCLEHQIGNFDLAFAYEAIARAYNVLGNVVERNVTIEKAIQASYDIAKQGDRTYFDSELKTISNN